MQALTDTLWAIDGHHKQGFTLPSFVSKLVEYNRPEISKYRTLKSVSSHLFDCSRENWKEFKVDVESLAQSLSNYTDYLQKSCKKTLLKTTNMCASPIRSISGQKSKYDAFWDEVQKFLQEDVGLAVEERRHSQVTHLARVISVRDILEQVATRSPVGTPIPCRSWLSLQFWPKNAHAQSRVHYSGRFNVKYMVQARQFRKAHEDLHYAAAIFRYQREFAVMFRENSAFFCMDDKHRMKVGEPNYPVAAAERGRRVLVRRNETFEVGDHDFTKFSLVPSVSLSVDVPEDVTGLWYDGDVFIGSV